MGKVKITPTQRLSFVGKRFGIPADGSWRSVFLVDPIFPATRTTGNYPSPLLLRYLLQQPLTYAEGHNLTNPILQKQVTMLTELKEDIKKTETSITSTMKNLLEKRPITNEDKSTVESNDKRKKEGSMINTMEQMSKKIDKLSANLSKPQEIKKEAKKNTEQEKEKEKEEKINSQNTLTIVNNVIGLNKKINEIVEIVKSQKDDTEDLRHNMLVGNKIKTATAQEMTTIHEKLRNVEEGITDYTRDELDKVQNTLVNITSVVEKVLQGVEDNRKTIKEQAVKQEEFNQNLMKTIMTLVRTVNLNTTQPESNWAEEVENATPPPVSYNKPPRGMESYVPDENTFIPNYELENEAEPQEYGYDPEHPHYDGETPAGEDQTTY